MLWVPSQYGFLNTLLLAWLPTRDVWQAFYIVNSVLMFLSAGLVYALLRSVRPGVVNRVFALALTLAAVFLVPRVLQRSLGFVPTPGELYQMVSSPLTLYNSVNWQGRELLNNLR